MNPHEQSKLNQRQKEQAAVKVRPAQLGGAQAAALEFASPEELLRHDAAQTEVPERVAERLRDSVRREPKASRPKGWWQRLFGG